MPSSYPGGLDTLATNKTDSTVTATDHPGHHNDLADAVNKIEGELGTTPSGGYSTVKDRLDDRTFRPEENGAVGNGTTIDTTALRSTLSAANAVNGTVFLTPGKTYRVDDHISTQLVGVRRIVGYGATITATTTNLGGGIRRGLLDIVGCSNLTVEGVRFTHTLANSLVCVSGSTDITFLNCVFEGAITGSAAICINTAESTSAIKNVQIERCTFRNMTNAQTAGVEVFTNSSRTVTGVTVDRCWFEQVDRYGVKFTATSGEVRATKITGCDFIDMIGPATSGGLGIGAYAAAVAGGADTAYQVQDTLIQGCRWRSSLTGTAIFCHVQATEALQVINNWAVHTGTNNDSNFIAPGRTTIPQLGLLLQGNYVEGFGSFWDPDSMYDTIVTGNMVVDCRPNGGLHTPYNQAQNVKIYGNTFRNSYNTATAHAAISTGIPTSPFANIEVTDNLVIDDQATPVIDRFLFVYGASSVNVSTITVRENRVYVPNGAVTGGATHENAGSTAPLVLYPNEIHDSAGRRGVARVFRTSHTFALKGSIANTETVPPFFASEAVGQTAVLAKARYQIRSGSALTFRLLKDGAEFGYGTTGSPLSAGTTAAETVSSQALADNNTIELDLIGGGPATDVTVTLVFEHTI